MINKEKIENIVNEYLNNSELFLVDVKVSKSNKIVVTIDGDKGVVVDDCVNVSREIESKMNRDEEDFELTVTSFGLEESFRMIRQYKKNINETIEVVTKDNEKESGVLVEADDEKIVLRKNNKKKKTSEDISLSYNDIDKARVIINF
ncbi:MAG: ribosome assembly cofactor RimP [Bacteroidales bacterium]|nr:ribosome assembly cofactor RimP [Bacteroidales bacterium]